VSSDDDLTHATGALTPGTAPASGVHDSFGHGRYKVERLLGRGGQKDVYVAIDMLLKRRVAIAVMKTRAEGGGWELDAEAQAMARLGDDPHIVTVYDIGEEDGEPYIVSQYIDSGSVADLLRQTEARRLPIHQTLRIGAEVARALAYCHRRGVIHGDVKPSNVFLTKDGTAKLGDFGIAFGAELPRLNREGALLGTFTHMAPEVATGLARGPASDLYALGIMLYELVTGRLPFQDEEPLGVVWQHINIPPVAPTWHTPQTPQALETLILRLLSKAPEDRPRSAEEVALALETITASGPPAAGGGADRDSRSLARLAGGIFVGREREMSALRAALDESSGGSVRFCVIAGEAGSGKTRLCEQFATYARLAGAEVLVGRCYDGEGAPAFWPWVQLLRSWVQDRDRETVFAAMGHGASELGQIVPDVLQKLPDLPPPPPLEPEPARFRLFDAIAGFLRNASRARPMTLLIDDLHWADRSSLLLLEFLARELHDASVMVLGTYRDEEQHAGALAQTLADLGRTGVFERIGLPGLAESEVASFIQKTTGLQKTAKLASLIYRQTDGNPFFVSEIVKLFVVEGRMRSFEDAAPGSIDVPKVVRDVILRRVAHLPEAGRRALTIASVIGREFGLQVLAPLCGVEDEALLDMLEPAVAAGLIVEKPRVHDTFAFSHALIRETLYETLGATRRVRLHRRIAETLEQCYVHAVEPHLAELAYHFFEAAATGEARKAIEYLTRAADQAVHQLAYEEAVALCERACQASTHLTPPDEFLGCELLLRLGETQLTAGHTTAARETFRQAAAGASRRQHGEQLGRAALGVGSATVMGTSYGSVDQVQIDLLEEALTCMPAGDSSLRARLQAQLAMGLYYAGGQRLPVSQDAVKMARRLGDRAALVHALYSRCLCLEGFEKGDERLALATEIIGLAQELDNREMVLRARYRRYRELIELGDLAAAENEIEIYAGLAQDLRQPLYQWLTPYARASLAVMQGRFDAAVALIEEAAALGKRTQERSPGLFIDALTSLMLKHQGRHAELETRVAKNVEAFPRIPSWRASLAQIYVKLKRFDDARRELARLAAEYPTLARDGSMYGVVMNLVEVVAALGHVEEARTLYSLLEPFEGRNIVLGSTGVMCGPYSHYLGLLDVTLSRWDAAARHFEAALEMCRAMNARPYECRTQIAYGELLAAHIGDRAKGIGLLEQALACARELGMGLLSQEAGERLERCAAGPGPPV
jgi:tetratricopeptide (TPR) repeat protein